jgi:hypothetical protein
MTLLLLLLYWLWGRYYRPEIDARRCAARGERIHWCRWG